MKKLLLLTLLTTLATITAISQIRYDDGGIVVSGQGISEFSVQGNSWNNRVIRYFFQNTTGDINPQNAARQQVRDAFALWQAQTRLYFIEVCNAAEADIVILWGAGNHGDAFPFDGVNNVLAHAFFPPPNGGAIAGDMHFDDDETWTELQRANGNQPIDLFTVALHEIGHSLGLNHTTVSGAIMEAIYTGSRRQLAADDIAGIRSIYGAPTAMLNGPNFMCQTGIFNLNEILPAGVNVVYTVQQTTNVVTLTQTGNTATLTRVGDGNVTLVATLTTGCGTLTFTMNVRVGTPFVTNLEVIYPTNGCLQMSGNNIYRATLDIPGSYVWGYTQGSTYDPVTIVNPNGTEQQAIRIPNTQQFNGIYIAGENICGVGLRSVYIFEFSPNCGQPDVEMKAKPTDETPELSTDNFTLLGNPVQSVLKINIPLAYIGKSSLTLMDLNGRTIKQIVPTTLQQSIQVGNLKPGIYLIRLSSKTKIRTLKFVKS